MRLWFLSLLAYLLISNMYSSKYTYVIASYKQITYLDIFVQHVTASLCVLCVC